VTVSVGGRVLDVPALLDAATGATQHMRALLAVMTKQGYTLAVPSVVRARAGGQLATAAELAELDWFCAVGTVLEIPLAATDAAELEQLAKDHFVPVHARRIHHLAPPPSVRPADLHRREHPRTPPTRSPRPSAHQKQKRRTPPNKPPTS
jgi:hypothetical protein